MKNMAKNQAKMQMVDDDEVENVGIMSGFMDDIEELMEEITQQEMAGEGDDADMARILGRSPDSPEVLMNNLRGDYRSIDARREELADRVGYNAAQQTPDEVLAMLQPVFAQQGVAALPMGGADMGPLPMDALTGMPPAGAPMDPAMMGAPPAGMPPMDPTMMAQMPPEGIASLPMDQGAMPPMQMARGGIVQHFQEGSDEDGVTPTYESFPSSRSSVSQRLRGEAEDEMIRLMRQQPSAVPSLQSAMQSRVPMYEQLLGTGDKSATQSQMLFDIAQAALGYAANVGPQGQPLRGSQAARLAGATQALPGQIGARVAAQQQGDQGVRMAALQAAEKDIQAIRDANLDLTKEQRSLMSSLARTPADSASTSSMFGSGMEGRARAFVTENASLYGSGLLNPEEDQQFEMAAAILQQPRYETDPLTGKTISIPPSLPEFVRDALGARGRSVPAAAAPATAGGVEIPGMPGALGAPATAETDQAAPLILQRNPLKASPREDSYYEANMPSLFNAANAQGPVPALKAFTFRTPLLNMVSTSDAGSITQGRQFIQGVKNALTSGFQAGTDRFSNTEREQLLADLDVAATVIDTPEAFQARLFAMDNALQSFQLAALARYNNQELNAADQVNAANKLADIHEIRALIGVPLHVNGTSDPRLRGIVLNNPVGTPLYVIDNRGMLPSVVSQELKNLYTQEGL